MALDHALGCEEGLDLVAQVEDIATLLGDMRWYVVDERRRDITRNHSGRLAPKPRH